MLTYWVGLGVTITVVLLLIVGITTAVSADQRRARHAALRRRQYDAELAMVRSVQNSVSEMFDAVRRQQ